MRELKVAYGRSSKAKTWKNDSGITVDNIGQSDSDVRLDTELAAKYYDALSTLLGSFDFGDESRVSLSQIGRAHV